MISLAIITVASVAVVFVVSLRTVNEIHARMLKDDERPTRASIKEKRRVWEQARKDLLDSYDWRTGRDNAKKTMGFIVRQLTDLADEEARCEDEVA